MKKIALILLLIGSCLNMNAQNKEIRKLYRSVKRSEQTKKIKLPGIILDLGMLVAKKELKEDPGGMAVYEAIKKINKLRLVSSEDQNFIQSKRTARLTDLVNAKMESLVSINTPDTDFNILIKEKKDRIKKIVILGHMEEDYILFAVNSNIDLKQLYQVINKYSGELDELDLIP